MQQVRSLGKAQLLSQFRSGKTEDEDNRVGTKINSG